ncbi:hypothetical protein GCM10020295_19500 [Streptomyces cinereospinus]
MNPDDGETRVVVPARTPRPKQQVTSRAPSGHSSRGVPRAVRHAARCSQPCPPPAGTATGARTSPFLARFDHHQEDSEMSTDVQSKKEAYKRGEEQGRADVPRRPAVRRPAARRRAR